MRLLARYREGRHVQVWTELYGVGPDIRESDWEEADTVARETMARVRRNVERLRESLPAVGYRFANAERVLVPPPRDVAEQADRLEAVIGALPLAFRVFWETVGSVDLSGEHPAWPHRLLDPLVVEIHQTTFVNYLRTVMRYAGLGGLSPVKRHGHPVRLVPPEALVLAAELEPF